MWPLFARCARSALPLVLAMGGLLASDVARANDDVDLICKMFAGRRIGTKDGQPVLATCEMIKRIKAGMLQPGTLSPFRSLWDTIRYTTDHSFEELIVQPGTVWMRQRCRQDGHFSLGAAGTYTCYEQGSPFRFFLDRRHHITKATVVIAADSEIGRALRARVQSGGQVDELNTDYILMLFHVEALVLNRLARPGETYRVENGALVVEISAGMALKHIWKDR